MIVLAFWGCSYVLSCFAFLVCLQACLRACFLACVLACLLACVRACFCFFVACLFVCLFVCVVLCCVVLFCLLACLLGCLLACLLFACLRVGRSVRSVSLTFQQQRKKTRPSSHSINSANPSNLSQRNQCHRCKRPACLRCLLCFHLICFAFSFAFGCFAFSCFALLCFAWPGLTCLPASTGLPTQEFPFAAELAARGGSRLFGQDKMAQFQRPEVDSVGLMWGAVGGIGMRWKAFASEDILNATPEAAERRARRPKTPEPFSPKPRRKKTHVLKKTGNNTQHFEMCWGFLVGSSDIGRGSKVRLDEPVNDLHSLEGAFWGLPLGMNWSCEEDCC